MSHCTGIDGVNLYLVGFRGTGAPAVGRKLAGRVGFTFVDVQELIVKRLEETAAAGEGSVGAGMIEAAAAEVFRMVAALNGCVVAAEGDMIFKTGMIPVIKERGIILWLKASGRTIVKRIEESMADRFANGRAITVHVNERDIDAALLDVVPLYEDVADFSVDTDGLDIDGVADAIWALLWQKG